MSRRPYIEFWIAYVIGVITAGLTPRPDIPGAPPTLAAYAALFLTTSIAILLAKNSKRLRFPLLFGLCLGIAWLPLAIILIPLFEILAG
jgi:hypothetical protein